MTLRRGPSRRPSAGGRARRLRAGRRAARGSRRCRHAARRTARVRRRGRGGLRGSVRLRWSATCRARSRASRARVEVIRGVDGNDITLFIHRPAAADGPLPGVLHLHGGGMVLLEAAGPAYARLRDELRGVGPRRRRRRVPQRRRQARAVPLPGRPERLRFSAGVDRRPTRPTSASSKLVVCGRVGRRQPHVGDGAARRSATAGSPRSTARTPCAPTSPAPMPHRRRSSPRSVENDEYFVDCRMMGALAKVYDPAGAHATEPAGLAATTPTGTISRGCRPT